MSGRRGRSCGSLPDDRPGLEGTVLRGRRDRRAEDVEGDDEVDALVVLAAGLARVDVVVDLHADHAAGPGALRLPGGPGEGHLARGVDALGEVLQLLVG